MDVLGCCAFPRPVRPNRVQNIVEIGTPVTNSTSSILGKGEVFRRSNVPLSIVGAFRFELGYVEGRSLGLVWGSPLFPSDLEGGGTLIFQRSTSASIRRPLRVIAKDESTLGVLWR